MRVLLTTDTIGGVWTFTRDLTEGLLERGHHVQLASLGREPSNEQSSWAASIKERAPDRFTYHPSSFGLEWQQDNGGAYLDAEAWLVGLAQAFSPDVLHVSQFCFGCLPVQAPVLITAHSDILSWGKACRPPHGLEPSPWRDRYIALASAGLAQATAVAAPTRWMLEALQEHFSMPHMTVVVPNGRPVLRPSGSTRKLQAISAGRLWDEAKNMAVLLQVRSPMPILIAGETTHDGAYAPDLGPAVELLGPLRQSALFKHLNESSIYIAPAVYEPFGLAVLEAGLCGCALLLNDLPSFREIWSDSALYFQSAEELSALLAKLAASPALLAQQRDLAYRQSLFYSADRMVDAYLSLYSQMMQVRLSASEQGAEGVHVH